jgi:hypothetical protein
MDMVVVLPAPFGPSRPKISFLFMEKEIPSTAGSVAFLKVLLKFLMLMMAEFPPPSPKGEEETFILWDEDVRPGFNVNE